MGHTFYLSEERFYVVGTIATLLFTLLTHHYCLHVDTHRATRGNYFKPTHKNIKNGTFQINRQRRSSYHVLERIIRKNRQLSETNKAMKKRIFYDEYPCPCSVKKDMETSEDVYIFLENFYEGLDTFDWDRFGLADLGCAYCLLQFATKLAESDRPKYNRNKIPILTNAKNNITEKFLELILERIRLFIKNR